MELLYKEEHLACLYLDNSPRPVIELREISHGVTFEEYSHRSKIIFLLEGRLTYMQDNFTHAKLEKGQILLLSPKKQFRLVAVDNTKILIIRLKNEIQFCECYLEGNLLRQTARVTASMEDWQQEPFLLRMNPAIEAYIESLQLCLEKGLRCKCYFETKVKELFYLFRAFYPKRELVLFFQDMLKMDSYFFYFVKRNRHNYKTVTELAAAMNMSLQCFEKQFKVVFDIPAYKWMTQQKAGDIYNALCDGQASLKELASRFGFSSKSSFSDFCKKNLGKTPGQIRKNMHVYENDE